MNTEISAAEIRAGDSIKVTSTTDGVLMTRTGEVTRLDALGPRVEEGGFLWHAHWSGEPTFELLDRPKPPLPTATGSTILVTRMAGYISTYLHMFLRADKRWEVIGTGATYGAAALQDWKLTKLVDA